MTLLAVASGTAAALIWLALAGILVAAVVLYWPRRFSGPLTEHERRLARRALRGRSFAWTLATPLLTVLGFVLLLPPPVHLKVPSHVMGSDRPVTCELDGSLLSTIAPTRSLYPWVEAVLCETKHEADLAQAILRTAATGFSRRADCPRHDLQPSEVINIELSLLEVAARAFILTGVELDAGPRLTDPDPWDIMKRTLDARGVPVCRRDEDGEHEGKGGILRLGPAESTETADPPLKVFAVVRGDVCEGVEGKLLSLAREVLDECTLHPLSGQPQCTSPNDRVVEMGVTCAKFSPDMLRVQHGGLILSAGFGRARVTVKRPVEIAFDSQELEKAFDFAQGHKAFARELERRGLPNIRKGEGPNGVRVVIEGNDVVIRTKNTVPPDQTIESVEDRPELHQGPFSWSGVAGDVKIECAGDHVRIRGFGAVHQQQPDLRDPTVMFPLVNTIAWAANALTTSTCAEVRQPPLPEGSRPILTAAQLDEAVAAVRRGRESLGLVCLALAICALALGLRRSVR